MNENQFKEKKSRVMELCDSIENVLLDHPLKDCVIALVSTLAAIPERLGREDQIRIYNYIVNAMNMSIEKMKEVYQQDCLPPATPSPNPPERNPC